MVAAGAEVCLACSSGMAQPGPATLPDSPESAGIPYLPLRASEPTMITTLADCVPDALIRVSDVPVGRARAHRLLIVTRNLTVAASRILRARW